MRANASRHSALSYEHATKLEAQLKLEVADLLAKAEAADKADIPDGMEIPKELALREARLKKIAEAKARIEARAKERFAREQAEHEEKLAARAAKQTGKKTGGKPPQPSAEGPSPKDQINLTDEESRIMPVAGGCFEQCYNAQAAVAVGSNLVVAVDVTQASNDKQQVEPMLEKLGALDKKGVGACGALLADTGYFSAKNVEPCAQAASRRSLLPPSSPPLANQWRLETSRARAAPFALLTAVNRLRAALDRKEPAFAPAIVNASLTQNFLRTDRESGLLATVLIRGLGIKP
jgi:hypothetical protein